MNNTTKTLLSGILLSFFFLLLVTAMDSSFAVEIMLPEDYANVYPGDNVIFLIKVINKGATAREDIALEFNIKDWHGNTVSQWSKTAAIETQLSMYEEFEVPSDQTAGVYYINVKVFPVVDQQARQAIASRSFQIAEIHKEKKSLIQIITLGSVLALMVGLLYEHLRISKLKISEQNIKKMVRR